MLDELYRSTPEEFVATRGRLVRALKAGGDTEGARALAARRKPTRAAAALNALAREHSGDVDSYLRLAAKIRDAQVAAARDETAKDAMRSLDRDRRDRLAALVARAASDPDDVQRALTTALADEDVANEVRSGTLEKIPDVATGFGAFGDQLGGLPDGATPARGARPARPSAAERRRAEVRAQLDADLEAAEAELVESERAVKEARDVMSAAERHVAQVARRVEKLRTKRAGSPP